MKKINASPPLELHTASDVLPEVIIINGITFIREFKYLAEVVSVECYYERENFVGEIAVRINGKKRYIEIFSIPRLGDIMNEQLIRAELHNILGRLIGVRKLKDFEKEIRKKITGRRQITHKEEILVNALWRS